MHEHAIAASLVRTVGEHARAHGAGRVVRVHVRIGAAAGVEIALLRTAWEIQRGTGPCRDADLVVESPPERWVCALCRSHVPPGGPPRCTACDTAAVLYGGDELLLARIEIERG